MFLEVRGDFPLSANASECWFAWEKVNGPTIAEVQRVAALPEKHIPRFQWLAPLLKKCATAVDLAASTFASEVPISIAWDQVYLDFGANNFEIGPWRNREIKDWPDFSVRLMPLSLDWLLPDALPKDTRQRRLEWLSRPPTVRYCGLLYQLFGGQSFVEGCPQSVKFAGARFLDGNATKVLGACLDPQEDSPYYETAVAVLEALTPAPVISKHRHQPEQGAPDSASKRALPRTAAPLVVDAATSSAPFTSKASETKRANVPVAPPTKIEPPPPEPKAKTKSEEEPAPKNTTKSRAETPPTAPAPSTGRTDAEFVIDPAMYSTSRMLAETRPLEPTEAEIAEAKAKRDSASKSRSQLIIVGGVVVAVLVGGALVFLRNPSAPDKVVFNPEQPTLPPAHSIPPTRALVDRLKKEGNKHDAEVLIFSMIKQEASESEQIKLLTEALTDCDSLEAAQKLGDLKKTLEPTKAVEFYFKGYELMDPSKGQAGAAEIAKACLESAAKIDYTLVQPALVFLKSDESKQAFAKTLAVSGKKDQAASLLLSMVKADMDVKNQQALLEEALNNDSVTAAQQLGAFFEKTKDLKSAGQAYFKGYDLVDKGTAKQQAGADKIAKSCLDSAVALKYPPALAIIDKEKAAMRAAIRKLNETGKKAEAAAQVLALINPQMDSTEKESLLEEALSYESITAAQQLGDLMKTSDQAKAAGFYLKAYDMKSAAIAQRQDKAAEIADACLSSATALDLAELRTALEKQPNLSAGTLQAVVKGLVAKSKQTEAGGLIVELLVPKSSGPEQLKLLEQAFSYGSIAAARALGEAHKVTDPAKAADYYLQGYEMLGKAISEAQLGAASVAAACLDSATATDFAILKPALAKRQVETLDEVAKILARRGKKDDAASIVMDLILSNADMRKDRRKALEEALDYGSIAAAKQLGDMVRPHDPDKAWEYYTQGQHLWEENANATPEAVVLGKKCKESAYALRPDTMDDDTKRELAKTKAAAGEKDEAIKLLLGMVKGANAQKKKDVLLEALGYGSIAAAQLLGDLTKPTDPKKAAEYYFQGYGLMENGAASKQADADTISKACLDAAVTLQHGPALLVRGRQLAANSATRKEGLATLFKAQDALVDGTPADNASVIKELASFTKELDDEAAEALKSGDTAKVAPALLAAIRAGSASAPSKLADLIIPSSQETAAAKADPQWSNPASYKFLKFEAGKTITPQVIVQHLLKLGIERKSTEAMRMLAEHYKNANSQITAGDRIETLKQHLDLLTQAAEGDGMVCFQLATYYQNSVLEKESKKVIVPIDAAKSQTYLEKSVALGQKKFERLLHIPRPPVAPYEL